MNADIVAALDESHGEPIQSALGDGFYADAAQIRGAI